MVIWDDGKNERLRRERGLSFDDVVDAILEGRLLDILEHRSRKNQRIFVVLLSGRVHAVPFLEDAGGNIVLKTIYPSRKLQRRYGKKPKTNLP